MQKNRIFSIILAICLIMPVSVMAEDIYSNILNQPPAAETPVEQPMPAGEESAAPLDEAVSQEQPAPAEQTYKQPVSKRKIAKKFLAAMAGVLISSFLIFFILTVYNKIRESILNQVKTPEGTTSLETPDDLEGAVKTFLDKTEWNNKL